MFGRQVLWEIRNDLTAEAAEAAEEEKREMNHLDAKGFGMIR